LLISKLENDASLRLHKCRTDLPAAAKGNGTLPTIEQTPLKTNTLTITTNKVNSAAAANAIAMSTGKKTDKKKKKTTKEK
jgi:hypothetical protein